ncbi:spe4 protein [Dorcoceras hygrometricum]|uniref:Spe4 protein n=1 Tax=Dorcoceras hygrometricum TaxID=472368 RepID=A0A2Z7BYW7_9LAMI|nr:spe4 protein [Dorcoceras hygrometricum]
MGEAVKFLGFPTIEFFKTTELIMEQNGIQDDSWFEEEIDVDLKWSFALNRVLHKGTSEYQDIALLDTKRFGKVLVIDGKMQSAETVFIMGGGEGSAAREALRHRSINKVVMCDIDKEVVDFCRKHLTANHEAFRNTKLNLVINDAKAELERREEKFDIIVGDLADPVEGGPCYQLYTKSFYQNILKPKLNAKGVFVTQAGPAGVFSHKEVFSSIYNTIKQVFKYARAYTAHVPSFADTWGWVIASDEPLGIDAKKMDKKIADRISGELLYLNGASFVSSTILNKTVAKTLKNESHVYTEDNARFIHGQGVAYRI